MTIENQSRCLVDTMAQPLRCESGVDAVERLQLAGLVQARHVDRRLAVVQLQDVGDVAGRHAQVELLLVLLGAVSVASSFPRAWLYQPWVVWYDFYTFELRVR